MPVTCTIFCNICLPQIYVVHLFTNITLMTSRQCRVVLLTNILCYIFGLTTTIKLYNVYHYTKLLISLLGCVYIPTFSQETEPLLDYIPGEEKYSLRAKAISDLMSVNEDIPHTCQVYVIFIRI